MRDQSTTAVYATPVEDPRDGLRDGVLALYSYGISVSVNHGHLIVREAFANRSSYRCPTCQRRATRLGRS